MVLQLLEHRNVSFAIYKFIDKIIVGTELCQLLGVLEKVRNE
jgi:hypothetical protein